MSQTTQQPGAGARGFLAVVAVAGAVLLATGCTNQTGDDSSSSDTYAGSSPYASATEDAYTQDPYTEDPYTEDPYTEDPYTEDPYAEATESEAPDPYTSGTCLNGQLPDSTTAQSVSGVDEVDCSASDAHYKVIESIPFTSDMNECNDNPRTEYAFSSRYTVNGATVNEYVYCLVGLGAYAR